jgi:hypothetical protein
MTAALQRARQLTRAGAKWFITNDESEEYWERRLAFNVVVAVADQSVVKIE